MPEITLKELRTKQADVEKVILNILQDFIRDTGVSFKDVNINVAETVNDSGDRWSYVWGVSLDYKI